MRAGELIACENRGTWYRRKVLGTIPVITRWIGKNLIGAVMTVPGSHVTPPNFEWKTTKK